MNEQKELITFLQQFSEEANMLLARTIVET